MKFCILGIFTAKISNNYGEKACHCRNGGTCYTSSSMGKLCQCPNGFTGSFCEIPICKFDRMKNNNDENLICFILATRINAGQLSCSQLSCQNGGTCQEQGLNGICNCKPGFTGQRCESGIMIH